jgi:type I site-specific restriction endonuclease
MNSEAQTRKEFIDTKLHLAGWDVNDLTQVSQEFDISVPLADGVFEPHTPYQGHQFSDYVLLGRDYQIRAIRAVMEGMEKKQRNFLLVMATGTGKTRTCISLVDALMRSGQAERVLFLVDRIALRDQGLAAFFFF